MGMPSINGKKWLFVGAVALFATACAPAYVDSAPEGPVRADKRESALPKGGFLHPKYGYLVVPLPGSRTYVPQGDGGAELIIESPRGYIATIEGRPIVKGKGVRDIAAELEAEFLGAGAEKRWNRKLAHRSYSVNGLAAYDAIYQGSDTQNRLVIMRGRKRDYLLMFFAPNKRYGRLAHEFDFIVDSFRLPEPGFAPAPRKVKPAQAAEEALVEEKAPVEPTVEMVPFPDSGLGYTVSYPKHWEAKQNGPYSVVFSGPEGTPAFFSTVIIQNVRPKGGREGADPVIASLTRQLRDGAKNVSFSNVTEFLRGDVAGFEGGKQFTAGFLHNDEPFKQWTVVLPRQDSSVVHVLSYTSPTEQFDRYRPMAGKIINSWRIKLN